MSPDEKDLHRTERGAAGAGEYAGVGLQFGGAILFFLFLGNWLDGKLGTRPWLLLLGVFVGFGAGFLWMYRRLVVIPRERGRRR
ncbi:MAG TPA: AtpZ/AtpI family protein [Longimicrobiaceae bacterium]|nr:AtpZ/AtpI family protein [Longimicrobiaceae bacterium]